MKPIDQLSSAELQKRRVWEFIMDMEDKLPDETYVKPVDRLPVNSLDNRLVSTLLTLATGQKVHGMLGNLDLANAESTKHFLSISVFHSSGKSFHLARYHDVDYSLRDATALATFLRLPVEAVFPLRYDISDVAVGHPECIRRIFFGVPTEQLSQEALIDLALK